MSRLYSRLIAVLAVLGIVLSVSAVACAGSGTSDKPSGPTQSPTEAPAATAAAESRSGAGTVAPTPTRAATPTPTRAATPTPTRAATPTPEAGPALAPDMVGLFLAVHGGSSSDRLRITGGNITIEKDAKAVVMYVPDTGKAEVIDSYTSPSYAPHTKRPYTVDDRLFLETKYSTSLTYTEYDPRTLRAMGNARAKEEVLASQREFRLKGARSEDPVTTISRADPSSPGGYEIVASFEVDNVDAYIPASWWHVAVDNGVAYWAAAYYEGQELVGEVWSYRLDDPASDPQMHRFTVPESAEEMVNILKFDVDDGYAVIQPRFRGSPDSRLILYDVNTGSVDLVDTGLRIFDVQLLHLGE